MSRIAWCTGAGKGIGRATSLCLAAGGWTVVASSRTDQDLRDLADAAAGRGHRVHPYPLDVTDVRATERCVDAIEADIGPISLAVLNAGTHAPTPAKSFEASVFRNLIETNYLGTVNGLAALLPRFIARRSGRIAVVASVAGYRGLPSAAAYGASKAALINMCEALKPELDRQGVRLSLINPGFVRTPLTDRNDFAMPFLMEADDAARRLLDGIESGRFETTFPRRFTWSLKLLRCLPYALYFPLTRRLVRSPRSP
jgi:NAD(P)-dependent dehydrogenase (short-subunit alcohol dehydrogenase family)